MLPGIQAVVFDAVGTLIHPSPAAALVYTEVGRRFGNRLPIEEITLRFRAAFARQEATDLAANLRTDEAREVQRWRAIVAEVLADATDPEACFRELYQHFARPDAWKCKPETAAVIEELGDRGYLLALASNYDERLRGVVVGLPELRRIGPLVISSEVGWRKPAADFFAGVCGCVGMSPGRVLFVGDDRANDYDGALAAGMQAVLFDPRGRESAPRRITHLAELLRLLHP